MRIGRAERGVGPRPAVLSVLGHSGPARGLARHALQNHAGQPVRIVLRVAAVVGQILQCGRDCGVGQCAAGIADLVDHHGARHVRVELLGDGPRVTARGHPDSIARLIEQLHDVGHGVSVENLQAEVTPAGRA